MIFLTFTTVTVKYRWVASIAYVHFVSVLFFVSTRCEMCMRALGMNFWSVFEMNDQSRKMTAIMNVFLSLEHVTLHQDVVTFPRHEYRFHQRDYMIYYEYCSGLRSVVQRPTAQSPEQHTTTSDKRRIRTILERGARNTDGYNGTTIQAESRRRHSRWLHVPILTVTTTAWMGSVVPALMEYHYR